jgi:hypothetical protein
MEAHPGPKMFASINVGTLEECYWWDYGMLKLYVKNNMLVSQLSSQAIHRDSEKYPMTCSFPNTMSLG